MEQSIHWQIDEDLYHLINLTLSAAGDIYVRFVSRNRETVQTSDPAIDKMPDHISYHSSGVIHIRHKKGQRSTVPLRLKSGLLNTPGSMNLPFLAVSYYRENIDAYKATMKISASTTVTTPGTRVISPAGSFTLVFRITDLARRPLENRALDVLCLPGTLPLDDPAPNLVIPEHSDVAPLLNCCLNPTWELIKQIR